MASKRAPSLAEVIRRALEARVAQIHTLLPARVTRYDASKLQVDVQPLIRGVYRNERNARQVQTLPVVTNVPVVLEVAGGFGVAVPISDGNLTIEGATVPATVGLLLVFERSTDRWLSGDGQVVDPEIDHLHALTDGVFLPGLFPFGGVIGGVPTDHMTVGNLGGVVIHLHRSMIVLGDESGAQPIPLGTDLEQRIAKLEAAYNAHTHPTGVGPSGATASTVDGTPTFQATQAKVK